MATIDIGEIEKTWDEETSDTPLNGIGLNIIDDVSHVNSNLMQLSIDDVTKFTVHKSGNTSVVGTLSATSFPSPTLTGIPLAPTAAPATNTTQIATTEFVVDAVTAIDFTPYAPKASPVFTGNPTAPTPTVGDNDFSIATTAFVSTAIAAIDYSAYAPKASPVFTGNPTAPTPTPGDNGTSIATTAFVTAALATIVPFSTSTAYTFTALEKFTGGLESYRTNTDGVVLGLGAGLGAFAAASDAICIGYQAYGLPPSTSTSGIYIGRHAGYATVGANAVIVGHAAAQYAPSTSSSVIIGYLAGRNLAQNASHFAFSAVIIGHEAGTNGLSTQNTVIIGSQAGKGSTSCVAAVMVGYSAGQDATTATFAVIIGFNAGKSATSSAQAVMIGYEAGMNSTPNTNSVYIGNGAGKSVNRANTLIIDGNTTFSNTNTALIYGEFDNRVLKINGTTTVAANVATPAGGSTTAKLLFGTTAGFGLYYGSGVPTVSAGQGSLYMRSDGTGTGDRLYVNTNGTTGWTNLVSAT